LRASFVAFALSAALVGGALVATPAPAQAQAHPHAYRTTPRVVVYGDSLAWEARDYITWLGAVNGMDVTLRAYGGTALCDWFPEAAWTLRAARPETVVWAFSGNNLTACIRPRGRTLEGVELARRYQQDARRAVVLSRAAGANVVFVGSPRSWAARHDAKWQRISAVYERVAKRNRKDVRFVDGGRLIAPGGAWRSTQPCLPREKGVVDADGSRPCRDGRIVVRAPDGAHFCPGGAPAVLGVTQACPRYSSGAFRYASTIVREAHSAVYGRYP
jgi:hypothetical protein